MKKIYLLNKKKCFLASIFLMAITLTLQAQIPNNDFEAWTNMGSYENPNIWGTPNSACTGSFHPVTKSTDHYPVSVGQYSIRLENNISLLPPTSYCGLGVAGLSSPSFGPGFQITGHPNSLTGYYKFLPQSGDTMIISIQLYNLGTQVAQTEVQTTVAAPSWVSFNLPIPTYTTADSASIRISAYCTCGPMNIPHGNSVLLVDNLNFDNLITSVSENEKSTGFEIFPNPTSGAITFSNKMSTGKVLDLSIINSLGQVVYSDLLYDDGSKMTITPKLEDGIYFVTLLGDDGISYYNKMIVSAKN